jgi:hypothetical protein
MNNPNLHTALCDLVCGICSVTLGSVEKEVIYEAGKALIFNWNDHNPSLIVGRMNVDDNRDTYFYGNDTKRIPCP